MSPDCAERCNVMHLLDVRFAGIARGVGTAKILGRIHSAQIKLGNLFLPCSITVMEGKGVDLLFGLDQLKRHQACIDLEKNVLRISGQEVAFLPEHEIPKHAEETLPVPDAVPPHSAEAVHAPQPVQESRYPEETIKTLMDLGVSRPVAIGTLDACGGNADMAANMLFQL